jgi:dihydropteroate synthase
MKKVLEAYETALEAVRGMDFKDVMLYLIVRDLHAGICFYCMQNRIDFYQMETYIFQTPYHCDTTSEIIETLEYRINYLKQNYENTF